MRRNRGTEQPSANPPENAPAAPATPVTPDAPATPATTTETTTETTTTPTAPQAPEPEQPTSRPWYRNWPRRNPRRRELPETEEGPLEREQNYSRAEEINQLVESVRNGSWEASDRSRIFEERYGRRTRLTEIKAWIAGEQDVTYDPTTGTVNFNYGTEVMRRLANLGVNTAQTGALMAAFGLLTGGGAAVAFGPALIGSTLGRAVVEAHQTISGSERTRREKLIIARERYYKKALELASRVGRDQPDNVEETNGTVVPWDTSSPEARANYEATRNAAVRDLVNFVHASEQNSVVFRQTGDRVEREWDEEGNLTNEESTPGGNYFVDMSPDRISGQPLEAGGRWRGEPSEGINAGPALNDGTEVYQPSVDAPDAQRLDELEKEFAAFRKRYDTMKVVFSGIGGLSGGVFQVLAAQKAQFVQLWQTLNEGGAVRLNIDNNLVWHWVQQAGQGPSGIVDGATNLVYHLNSQLEALRATVQGSTIIPGLSEFGSHTLQATLGQIVEAVNRQAWFEAARTAGAIIGGLGSHALWKRGNIKGDFDRFTKNRDIFEQNEEMLRRRGVPEERAVPIEELARQNNKPMPEVDQVWRIPRDEDFEYIRIMQVDRRGDRVVLTIERDRPGESDLLIDRISAEQLLLDPWQAVIRRERNPRPAPGTPAPGTPPAPAVPVPPIPEPEPTPPVAPAPPIPPTPGPGPTPPIVREQEQEEDDDLISGLFDDAEREMEEEQRRPQNEQPEDLEQPENTGLPFKVNQEYTATNLRQLNDAEKADYEQASGGRNFNDKLFESEINGRVVLLRFADELPTDSTSEIVVDSIQSLRGRPGRFELDVHIKKEAEPEPEENPEDENNFSEEAKKALQEARDPFNSRNAWVVKRDKVPGSSETRPVKSIQAEKVEEPEEGLQKINLDPDKNYSITIGKTDEEGHTTVVITTEGLDLIAPIETVRTAFELKSIRDCGDEKVKERAVKELIKAVYAEANKVKENDEEPPQDPESDDDVSGTSPEQDLSAPVELEFVQLSSGEEIRPGFTLTLYEDRSGKTEKQAREISKIYGGGGKIGVVYTNGERRAYSLEDLQKGLDNKVVEIIKP